ncbi:MAG: serine/threonine protein kinase, partial [Massilia sp.]|nr:serine/threonine protein kinase [Massilia sp.]
MSTPVPVESASMPGKMPNNAPGGGMPDRAAGGGSENCLPIGTRLADFEITGVLGEGGFGIVYIAYDHSLQRAVAIKEYMPGALAMRGADRGVSLRAERHQETFKLGLKSFINEARFLAQFDHPSLVKVYRFWEQNRTAYTAMQYYEGRTIKQIVADSPELIDEAWCRKILRQILQALEMLYTVKILHRDISPDNIIVQANGDAVLLDFGSARQIIGDMTKGLTVILKPGYAPVEQYAGDASLEQGPFTDIYALAAVMYFAILKQAPPSSIARMIKDPVAPLQVQAPHGYSPSFLAAIDKSLAVLAQDRPQSIDQLRDLLGIVSLGPPPPARMLGIGAGARGAPATPLESGLQED